MIITPLSYLNNAKLKYKIYNYKNLVFYCTFIRLQKTKWYECSIFVMLFFK